MNIWRNLYYSCIKEIVNRRFLHQPPVENIFSNTKVVDLLLITVAFNNAQVLDWQLALCKRFIEDEYLHVILDNSSSLGVRRKNKSICVHHGVAYISLPPNPWTDIHNSRSHGIALDWAFRHVVPQYSFQVLGLLDHDVFPVKRHSLLTDMNDKLYMGVLQERTKLWYLWPGLFFVRSSALDLDNFSMLPTGKADTGGALWEKVFRHMDRKEVFFWEERECRLREGASRQSAFYYQIGPWIHTVNASYWDACAPKEKGILHFLRKETGITDLFAESGEG